LVLEPLRTDEEFALYRGEHSNQRLSHGDRVELNVNSENPLSGAEEILGSWCGFRRCEWSVPTRCE
jgi:hypothetical protein